MSYAPVHFHGDPEGTEQANRDDAAALRRPRAFRCSGDYCGDPSCARCFPGTYDDATDDEEAHTL